MFNIGTKSPDHKDAHYRSLTKAVTWRLTGSFDTLVLSFLITGNIKIAGTISAVEIVTKILLFYFHERIWALIPWGRTKAAAPRDFETCDNCGRTIAPSVIRN